MRNQIYYLLDLHKKCSQIIMYDNDTINKYCDFVNFELNRHFSVEEQKQLKLYNFNYDKLYQFAYGDVDNITFHELDNNKLHQLFDEISYYDIF